MVRFRFLPVLLAFALLLAPACGGGNKGGGGQSSLGSNLPSCGSTTAFFDTPFTDMAKVTGIVPLGNMYPSAHTFPTDHMYAYYDIPQLPANVYAPGALTLVQVAQVTYTVSTFRQGQTDYTLTLMPCSQVQLKFGHVESLDAALLASIGTIGNCYSYSVTNETVQNCSTTVDIGLTSGQLIGQNTAQVGDQVSTMDLFLYDTRSSVSFINTGLHGYMANSGCVTDYYDAGNKSTLEALLGSYDGATRRTVSPVCGTIEYDVAGTAQGLWVRSDAPSSGFIEGYGLALVYDNVDPTQGAISIRDLGTTIDKAVVTFTPLSSGTTDRFFNQVTSDSNIYCYNANGSRMLIQLTGSQTMNMEVQSGACGGSYSFTGAVRSYRR